MTNDKNISNDNPTSDNSVNVSVMPSQISGFEKPDQFYFAWIEEIELALQIKLEEGL